MMNRASPNRQTYSILGVLGRIGPFEWLLILGVILLRLLTTISHGISFHPDERHIIMTVQKLSLEDPNPHSFAYGSFVFYLLAGVSWALSLIYAAAKEYDTLFIIGRTLSVFMHLAISLLCYLVSFRLYQSRFFAFSALFLCLFNPFFIQVSHFYTSDLFLTLFSLAALSSMVCIERYGRISSYLLAGLSMGLAVVSKITAISLLAPFGFAWLANRWRLRSINTSKAWGYPALAVITAAVIFVMIQPYAIIDFETFWKDVWEQINMVRGVHVFPYNLQHQHTLPYIYYIAQFPYTFGTPVALALIGSLLVCLFRRPTKGEFILILWVAVLFIIVGKYQVKFPRYLLPIYPPLFILLGGAVRRLEPYVSSPRRFLLLPLTLILGTWTLLHGFANITLYWQDHPYISASEWVFRNIPAGKVLLSVHWDDKVPVDLPGYSTHQYRMWEPEQEIGIFEDDHSGEKIRTASEQLAKGDYLILPTPRAPIGVLQTPDRFPYTTKLLRLLYNGDLGYVLQKTIKARPSIGSFVINDDTADESLSVYDHPKVAIFRKEKKLKSHQIFEMIMGEYPDPHLTKAQVLLMNSNVTDDGSVGTVLGSILVWLLSIELLAALALPVLLKLFDPFVAAALSRPLGLLIFSFLVWVLNSAQLLVASPLVLRWTLVLLSPLLFFIRRNCNLAKEWRLNGVLWLSILSLVLLTRAFQPEIYWGEKPMDFTFLNYFVRNETLPPQDPWAVGHPMKYYYLGFYLFGLLHKVSGLDPAYGFNLAIATTGALLSVALTGAIGTLLQGRHRKATVTGAILILFTSNLEMTRLVLTEEKANFDTFWASTRLFTSPAFSEYPLWSLLFADLHAHVMSMPFFVLGIALLFRLMAPTSELGTTILAATLFGVTWGLMLPLNGWDFITLSALGGVFYFFRLISIIAKGEEVGERSMATVSEGLITLLVALLSMGYFVTRSMGGQQIGYGLVQPEEFNSLRMVLLMVGGWLILAMVPLLRETISSVTFLSPLQTVGRVGGSLAPIVLLVGISLLGGVQTQPFLILLFAGMLALLSLLSVKAKSEFSESLPLLLILFASWLLVAIEIFYLIDRMNTIFKFYIHLWILFGIGATALFIRWYNEEQWRSLRGVAAVFLSIFTASGIFGAASSVYAMVKLQRVDGPRPTLNGTAYLTREDRDDAEVLAYIRRNIKGTPALVEAWGDSYQAYTRVAMHTGLPTLLGWEYHLFQRGLARDAIEERKRAIETIYTAESIEDALRLLSDYSIRYIFVGRLEREKYGTFGLEKFKSSPLIEKVFSSGQASLYRVKS